MKDLPLLVLFIVASLFSLAFIARRFRTASPIQRRQILFAALGALALVAGLFCLHALK